MNKLVDPKRQPFHTFRFEEKLVCNCFALLWIETHLAESILEKKMGSIDAACIAGFLCRLCSEMHRTVIHIYGDVGQKHDLARKINAYLPVTVNIIGNSFWKRVYWIGRRALAIESDSVDSLLQMFQ